MNPSSSSKVLSITGRHYATGQAICIMVQDGIIIAIEEADAADCHSILAPGLVDLQLNGYAGIDVNTSPLQPELIGSLTRKLWSEGVTAWYPTIITNSDEAIAQSVRAIAEACRTDTAAAEGVAGIHLEGPFISPQDGPRGAHDIAYVKPPNWDLFQRWQEAAEGRIRLVTISPEWPNAASFIASCTKEGVTVSIGHTAASPEQIQAAVSAGARMSTHFGNGAHLQLPRHPNYLWAQLAEDHLWTSVIADGFHLPDSVLKVVLRVKGKQALLVSDAVFLSGMPAGRYETHIGGEVELTPEGRLELARQPELLAGSAQMLLWGVSHLTAAGLCGFADAWEMASIRPSELMGLATKSGLTLGAPADVVLLRKLGQNRIHIQETYKCGRLVYQRT